MKNSLRSRSAMLRLQAATRIEAVDSSQARQPFHGADAAAHLDVDAMPLGQKEGAAFAAPSLSSHKLPRFQLSPASILRKRSLPDKPWQRLPYMPGSCLPSRAPCQTSLRGRTRRELAAHRQHSVLERHRQVHLRVVSGISIAGSRPKCVSHDQQPTCSIVSQFPSRSAKDFSVTAGTDDRRVGFDSRVGRRLHRRLAWAKQPTFG